MSFIVSTINFYLKMTFRLLAKFERYKSLSHETGSVFKKLFVAIFINMAILLLLINADFQDIKFIRKISEGIPVAGDLFFNGRYDDLNRSWYPRLGLAFLILVISTIVSNVLSTIFWELFRVYKRKISAKKELLQADMNAKMMGGIFELDGKYALTLALIFMCHLYYGAVPLLLPLLAIYFIIQFWIDKLYITQFARKPPHYDSNMHEAMVKIIPVSLFFH